MNEKFCLKPFLTFRINEKVKMEGSNSSIVQSILTPFGKIYAVEEILKKKIPTGLFGITWGKNRVSFNRQLLTLKDGKWKKVTTNYTYNSVFDITFNVDIFCVSMILWTEDLRKTLTKDGYKRVRGWIADLIYDVVGKADAIVVDDYNELLTRIDEWPYHVFSGVILAIIKDVKKYSIRRSDIMNEIFLHFIGGYGKGSIFGNGDNLTDLPLQGLVSLYEEASKDIDFDRIINKYNKMLEKTVQSSEELEDLERFLRIWCESDYAPVPLLSYLKARGITSIKGLSENIHMLESDNLLLSEERRKYIIKGLNNILGKRSDDLLTFSHSERNSILRGSPPKKQKSVEQKSPVREKQHIKEGNQHIKEKKEEKQPIGEKHPEPVAPPIDPLECTVCMATRINVRIDPCGHLYCRDCISKIKQCPNCRTEITRMDSIFIP